MSMSLAELKKMPPAELAELGKKVGLENVRTQKQNMVFSILQACAEKGEDIYGKPKDNTPQSSTGKYVPPHLRKKQEAKNEDRTESLRAVERLLNNSLNRLSEDTLLSVAQAIAKLYDSHPKSDLNDSIWKITRNSGVERSLLMTGRTTV